MLYAHTWYFWIQHNSIFQSSHDMCLYDNLWPSNYKVTENNLKIYSFLASPPILGMCFKVSIHYIHQDIHFNLLPRAKVTSWLHACQVSKLSELVLLSYISLYVLTPRRPGSILSLFSFWGYITICVNLTMFAVKYENLRIHFIYRRP